MSETWKIVVAFCAGSVAIAGFVGIVWWLIKPRVTGYIEEQLIRPVRETHHQVTVNHHSSKEPTVLDKLDTVRQEVAAVVKENREQNRKIDSVQRDVTALTLVLDAHLHGGDVGDDAPDLD